MLRKLLINCGLVDARIGFYGIDVTEIASFVCSVKSKGYIRPESPSRSAFEYFQFDRVLLKAIVAPGNRGGRQIMRDALCKYDGIAFFIDATDHTSLLESREELDSLLCDNAISQPIVILVRQQNASGCANEPSLISKFNLEDVIRRGNGRVALFAYSLSPTHFTGCEEGVRWLLKQI